MIKEDIKKYVDSIKNTMAQFKREEVGNRLSNFSVAALEIVINQDLDKIMSIVNEEAPCPSTPPEQSQ